MQRIFRLLFTLILPTILIASTLEQKALAILSQYDQDGLFIVKSYLRAPKRFSFPGGVTIRLGGTEGFSGYLSGQSRKQLLSSLNTVVHEMCHGFTSRIPLVIQSRKGLSRKKASAFYIGGNSLVLAPHRGIFPSRTIRHLIPARFHKYRFSTYIHPSSPNLGTQVDGIYGLMDEWNAYYHGTRTSLLLVNAWLKLPGSPGVWSDCLTGIYGTLYAYGEFKMYILAALEYARQNNPNIYQKIMKNKAFITAFKRINNNWIQLLKKVDINRKRIFKHIRRHNYQARMNDRIFMIFSPDGNGTGRGHFLDYFKKLQAFLNTGYCKTMETRILNQPEDLHTIIQYK